METDPQFEHLKNYGPNIMEVHEYKAAALVARRFSFRRSLWNAWSPRLRASRNRRLIPHPTPVRDALDYWWNRLMWGKAWAEGGYKYHRIGYMYCAEQRKRSVKWRRVK